MRQSAKPFPKKDTANSTTTRTKKLEATYGKMKQRLEKEYDVNQVLSLTVSILRVRIMLVIAYMFQILY